MQTNLRKYFAACSPRFEFPGPRAFVWHVKAGSFDDNRRYHSLTRGTGTAGPECSSISVRATSQQTLRRDYSVPSQNFTNNLLGRTRSAGANLRIFSSERNLETATVYTQVSTRIPMRGRSPKNRIFPQPWTGYYSQRSKFQRKASSPPPSPPVSATFLCCVGERFKACGWRWYHALGHCQYVRPQYIVRQGTELLLATPARISLFRFRNKFRQSLPYSGSRGTFVQTITPKREDRGGSRGGAGKVHSKTT